MQHASLIGCSNYSATELLYKLSPISSSRSSMLKLDIRADMKTVV